RRLAGVGEEAHQEAAEGAADGMGVGQAVDVADDLALIDDLALGGHRARRQRPEHADGGGDDDAFGHLEALADEQRVHQRSAIARSTASTSSGSATPMTLTSGTVRLAIPASTPPGPTSTKVSAPR